MAGSSAQGMIELTTLVRDCSVSGVARRVLLLRSDLLPPRLSREHHLRLAREALEPLQGADRARTHELSHGRIAISWRGEAVGPLQQALAGLQHLLQDAPADAPTVAEMARLFDLPKDGAALLALAGGPLRGARAAAHAPETRPRPPLDLMTLDGIETRLATASVARFARRRTVCGLSGGELALAWEVRHLNIEELSATLCPGRNPFADPWLFRRLSQTLDRRMLALLAGPAEIRNAAPFALDLNAASILLPEFMKFDAALPATLRGHVVLNLHPADVLADLATFRFACAFARSRGYRILLRALSGPLLPMIALPALELDFAELRWAPGLPGLDPAAMEAGGARWVLSRADGEDALQWGIGAGIGLFQGDGVVPGLGVRTVRPVAA